METIGRVPVRALYSGFLERVLQGYGLGLGFRVYLQGFSADFASLAYEPGRVEPV